MFGQGCAYVLISLHRHPQGAKKIRGNTLSPASNYGYDDDKGDYRVVPGDHIAYRYEVVSVLGTPLHPILLPPIPIFIVAAVIHRAGQLWAGDAGV